MFEKLKNNWTKWHHIFHKAILTEKELIPNGSNLVVSVSGGQDSMALLTLLDDIKRQHDWSLNIWHGNHNWHEQSNYFANQLKKFCLKKNLNFYIDSADEIDISTEEKARKWRYQKLYELANKINTENKLNDNISIVTGHTSSDNAETFLMNLSRGSNLKGLEGIDKKRLLNKKYFLVRPILLFSRDETALICKELNIPYWVDPSNSDLKLTRNLIRLKVIKNLENIYPGCSSRINNYMQKMRNFNNERTDLSKLAITSCVCREGIKRNILNKLGKEARATILNTLFLDKCNKQISSKNIDFISNQILIKSNGQETLTDGLLISWNREFIQINN
tara:strand:+ start:1381 stop:2382 length:1002 start_codon:yes stop_codon:yes gene_type:complete